MHSSKLLTLIGSLQQEEIHWFRKFLKSPFYNTNELYVKLFDHIRKYYPELSSPKLSKEDTCQKLFPNEKVNVQKIRKTMHGLAALAEEFLVAIQIRKKPFEKKKLLVKGLGERNVYTLFKKGTNELLGELEALPYRDVNYYKEVHELNLEFYGHAQTNKQKGNDATLVSAVNHLNYYYLIQQQRLDFTVKWHEKLIGNKFRTKTLEQSKTDLKNETVFKLYALVIKSLGKADNDAIYLEMETLFKNKVHQLGKNDQFEIFILLFNHLSSRFNHGKTTYRSKMFSLNKFGLDQNLILRNDQITEATFLNIASISIAEGAFEWTEWFIKEYTKALPQKIKQDVISLSFGLLYFYRKQFSESTNLLSSHTFLKPLYNLNSKTILLRSYFEQFLIDDSYYDLLIAQSNAFEKFIRRNDFISKSKKEPFLNFILFTRKITNAIYQNTLDQNLFNLIKNKRSVILKDWLLEKISQNI